MDSLFENLNFNGVNLIKMLEKIEKFIEKQVEEAKDEFDNYINEI